MFYQALGQNIEKICEIVTWWNYTIYEKGSFKKGNINRHFRDDMFSSKKVKNRRK
jgi:hypothetical protein